MAATEPRNGARAGLSDRIQSSAVVAAEAPSLVKMINNSEKAVARALPTHLKASAPAYVRAAVTLVKQNPDLARCDPYTILGGLMTASSLGLEFGPLGHCYLVPFSNHGREEAQFQLGYKGVIDLTWRSGRLLSIAAREVREHDEFDFDYGLADSLHHKPRLNGERGEGFAWYCVAKFTDGGHYFVVLDKADVARHRSFSKSQSSKFSPWNTSPSQMALKSSVHEAKPYLPLTTEVLREMAFDGAVIKGADVSELEVEEVDFIDTSAVTPNADGEIPLGEVVDDPNDPEDDATRSLLDLEGE